MRKLLYDFSSSMVNSYANDRHSIQFELVLCINSIISVCIYAQCTVDTCKQTHAQRPMGFNDIVWHWHLPTSKLGHTNEHNVNNLFLFFHPRNYKQLSNKHLFIFISIFECLFACLFCLFVYYYRVHFFNGTTFIIIQLLCMHVLFWKFSISMDLKFWRKFDETHLEIV